jgi:Glutathione-dependent formaldehyde-activating enzyme
MTSPFAVATGFAGRAEENVARVSRSNQTWVDSVLPANPEAPHRRHNPTCTKTSEDRALYGVSGKTPFSRRSEVLQGSCACGATEYEVEDVFSYAMNCHCSKCRAATGSAYKPMGGIEREKLRVTREEISDGLPQFQRYVT